MKASIVALCVVIVGSLGWIRAAASERPNIVLILCDDLGIGDVHCFNPDSKIVTSKLDALAAKGIRFTNAHSPSSVCTPTRYGLLTGRYCWRSRLQQGVLGGASPPLIADTQLTVAEMLQQAGYRTACFGKWHLGLSWARASAGSFTDKIEAGKDGWLIDFSEPITNGPLQHGFDRFFGISASLDMIPYSFIDQDRVATLPDHDADFPMSLDKPKQRTRRGPASPGFDAVDVLPKITDMALNWIREVKASENQQPFFAYIPLTAPHTPIVPGREWQGRSAINAYADFVMETDAAIGKLMDCLDELQIADNTFIIVTSDNGCSPQADYPRLLAAGHNPSSIYRGTKADIFEGGHRVPMIVRWPQRVAANQTSDALIGLNDVLATLQDCLALDVQDDVGPDSFSFASELGLDSKALRRESLVLHSINGSFAFTRGAWKLCGCPDSGGWSLPLPQSAAAKLLPSLQLYDLAADPGEKENVLSRHPQLVREMLAELSTIIERGRSTPGEPLTNDVLVDKKYATFEF